MMEMIRPNTNGMDIHSVIMQPHLVITNLSRLGDRLDFFLVRCSNCNPHFINKDCYKNAIVYGESDWIGDRTFENIYGLNISPNGEILPAQVIDWGMTATEHMQIYEDFCRRADNDYIGELK